MIIGVIITISIFFGGYLCLIFKACSSQHENQMSEASEPLINIYSLKE